jgi:hypothetical protein
MYLWVELVSVPFDPFKIEDSSHEVSGFVRIGSIWDTSIIAHLVQRSLLYRLDTLEIPQSFLLQLGYSLGLLLFPMLFFPFLSKGLS